VFEQDHPLLTTPATELHFITQYRLPVSCWSFAETASREDINIDHKLLIYKEKQI
jgi:hypothetical protein